MRNYNDSFNSYGSANSVLAESSARTFMQRVYAWMSVGLALTGATAYFVASSTQLMGVVLPLMWPLFIVQFVMALGLQFMARRMSAPLAGVGFVAYSLLTGVTFSVLFLAYTSQSLASSFFITAGAFGALSLFAAVTKKDLSGWRSFLFIGMVGVVIASVVSAFFHSGMFIFIVNCAALLVFGGLTAYNTQMLRRYHADMGFKSSGSLAVFGALILYISFVNMFLSILSLTGSRRS